MRRRPDPNVVWEARLNGVIGRIQGALWTANVDSSRRCGRTCPASPRPSTPSSSC
jgi:hypothetical protein